MATVKQPADGAIAPISGRVSLTGRSRMTAPQRLCQRRLASQPKPPPRRLGNILIGCLYQSGCCLFNLIGRMVGLVDLLRQQVAQHRKPCCMVIGASPSAVHDERFKHDGSSPCACHKFNLYAANRVAKRFLQKENGLSLWCASRGGAIKDLPGCVVRPLGTTAEQKRKKSDSWCWNCTIAEAGQQHAGQGVAGDILDIPPLPARSRCERSSRAVLAFQPMAFSMAPPGARK